jgi:hypothetical protein
VRSSKTLTSRNRRLRTFYHGRRLAQTNILEVICGLRFLSIFSRIMGEQATSMPLIIHGALNHHSVESNARSTQVVIIWLDQHIDRPGYCQELKKAFSTTFDPEWNHPTPLDHMNIDKLIKCDDYLTSCWHESDAVKMQAFSEEEDCARCIQENKDKRIFFIVSSSIGERFVPRIHKNCRKVLQGSLELSCSAIYVFCRNILDAQRWAFDDIDHVRIFDHEISLLTRLLHDIGDYFVSIGQEQFNLKVFATVRQSLKYFNWAKTLFIRADKVEKNKTFDNRLRNVNSLISAADVFLLQQSIDDDNDDDVGQYNIGDKVGDEVDDDSAVDAHEFACQDKLNVSPYSFQIEQNIYETSFPLSKSASIISSIGIHEQLVPKSEESIGDRKDSSDVRVLLQLPSSSNKDVEKIRFVLKRIFDASLTVVQEGQNYFGLFKQAELSVFVLPLSNDDDKLLLNKVCTLDPLPSIYLLGSKPNTAEKREEFFTKYCHVCAMLGDPRELAGKITLDVALNCRVMGDRYARIKEKDRSIRMYDQCIKLLKRLDIMAQEDIVNKE